MAEFKGFMGDASGGNRAASQHLHSRFEYGVFALSSGRIAEAYLYFLESDQNQSAVLYNMALCFCISENYERALSYLDGALRVLPSLPVKAVTVPQELERYEARSSGYKSAMLMDAPKLYPERCRVSMLRLKVDILLAMGNIEELKKLLPALSGGHYENVEKIKKILEKER